MAQVNGRPSIGILGSGAVGGFLAILFARAGYPVTLIGRTTTGKETLILESFFFEAGESSFLKVATLTEPLDLLLITVKGPFLSKALERIKILPSALISLLNGIGHVEQIRRALKVPLAVATIGAIEVIREGNRIRHFSRHSPHIDIASDHDLTGEQLAHIAREIEHIGISVSLLSTEAEVLWRKLVRLNAIASMTALVQKPIGVIRADPLLRETLACLVHEAAAVARAEGVVVDPEQTLREIDVLPSTLTTSLQHDIAARTPSEIESITGGVLARAEAAGVLHTCLTETYRRLKELSISKRV